MLGREVVVFMQNRGDVLLCGTVLTPVLVQVADGVLVGEDDGLVLGDDLSAEVLPARRQLPQLLQLTHPVSNTHTHTHTHSYTPRLSPAAERLLQSGCVQSPVAAIHNVVAL